MRPNVPAAIGAALLLLVPSGAAAQQQFTVFASIDDGTGAPVVSLEPSDLRVTENGAAAPVIKIEPIDWPTKLQILVDNGVGLGSSNLINLKNGVQGLIDKLPPDVEVTLVATAPQPRFLVRSTTDREAIAKGLALLVSDGGAGRFVESLNEALQRFERDNDNFFPAIISVGTTAGDLNVLDRDIKSIMQRLERRPATVHVVMLSSASSIGANQIQVGLAVTQFMKGRYENINAGTRIASLLPELGALVARSDERQRNQYRITVQRPAGASGPIAQVRMAANRGFAVTSLSLDGRVP